MASTAGGQGTLIGATLGGYQVESLIGRGAMGTVYLARDLKLNRHVALKVLLGSLARTPSVVKQFHLEAQAAAPLKHPGIVRIYSAGVERGTPFIAMEYVDGEPLDRFLRRTGPLKWQHAFHIGAQVALALDCAHKNGIVHRDVKPSNIMLDKNGRIRLADFGIANIQSEGDAKSGPAMLGTPQYMSPEQCGGQRVGTSSDLFALGVILYQMIAGDLPFHGESSMALVKVICTENPRRLNERMPDVPDDVGRLVAYLLEKDPEDRPANARVVHGLITRLQEQEGGRSAIPAALTAFIKEELEVRPHSGGTPARSDGRRGTTPKPGTKLKERRRSRVGAGVVPAVAIAVCAVVAFALPFASRALAGTRTQAPAPALEAVTFAESADGALDAKIQLDGYEPVNLAWSSDGTMLLIQVDGLAGGLTEDARGVLLLDPLARTLRSVEAPVGPGFDAQSVLAPPPAISFASILPEVPRRSPLADALPVVIEERGAALVLPQRLGEAAPRPAVLARVPQIGRGSAQVVRVLPHPRGDALALVLRDGDNGDVYISERPLGDDGGAQAGKRLTGVGTLMAETARYSPTGDRIAYVRRGGGSYELWVTASGGTSSDERQLVEGLASPIYAYRGTGESVAVSLRDGQQRTHLALVDLRNGAVMSSNNSGELAPGAWDGGSGAMVYRRLVGNDEALSTEFLRTTFRGGDEDRPVAIVAGAEVVTHAVDPTGRWLAAIVAPADGRNTIRIIPLLARSAATR